MPERDLYATLGVSRTATADQIRRAYRKLARKHHPDVNPGDEKATETFKDVSAAYEVLSDEKKRKAYDEFGDAALRTGFDPEKAREYQRWQREAEEAPSRPGRGGAGFGATEGFDFDLGDLFGETPRRRAGPAAGEDLVARVDLDLAQAIQGTELTVEVPTGRTCATCSGTGLSAALCPTCQGKGRVPTARGPMRIVSTCPTCGGTGHPPCPTCGGTGTIPETRRVTVRIPPGADEGSRLRVPGLGQPGRAGGPPGDLYIETHIRPHPHFRREGLDLYLTLPITVDEAYNGATIEVPTPGGSALLKIPPRSQSGNRLRLRGKGVTKGTERGDLYVDLAVRLPDREDPAFAAAARTAAASAYTQPVRGRIEL